MYLATVFTPDFVHGFSMGVTFCCLFVMAVILFRDRR